MPRGSPKGTRYGGGSRKGVPNKVNKELKDMILGALDQAGGQEYLYKQALANPQAFLSLIGKVLPKDINASIAADVIHKIQRVKLTPL